MFSRQKRSQSARPVIQSAQVPERQGSFHGDPCPLFAASRRIGRIALRHDMSSGGQDQRPGKFDRRVRPIPRVNHCDPMITRGGGDIDRRVYRSRRGNELEIGKALNDVAGQRGPLAHDTNDIKRQQPLNHGVRIGEVVLKYGEVRSIAEQRPIGALKRHILVIVQNSASDTTLRLLGTGVRHHCGV